MAAPSPWKAIGESFPIDQNSKNSWTMKGEVWALPRPHIFHSQSQETSPTTHVQESSLQRGVMLTNARVPTGLLGWIHLG